MSTTRAFALSALVAAAAACGGTQNATPGPALRQPSAVALFHGVTIDEPAEIRPYLAVASAARSEIALVDASDGTPVLAPIQLKTLVVPAPDRPAILASASLGDGGADLLVVASDGDGRVQLVRTWTAANAIEDAGAADLGLDVLALAAVPSPAGTARVAAALVDGGFALVHYEREPGGPGIFLTSFAVQALSFQPVSLATAAGDGTHVWAATRDELAPGVHGVAELDVTAPSGPWPVRALDARGPTRLVAAARLQERADASAADDDVAFAGQPTVTRVYAALDESGCGPGKRIDCGIAMLDPAAGGLVPDWPLSAPAMPYRAPLRLPARPLALAIATPPQTPPPTNPPAAGFMRLYRGSSSLVSTTAVGAVACDDGSVHFLDLGRFKVATSSSPLAARPGGTPSATYSDGHRIYVRDPATGAFPPDAEGSKHVRVTPGWTPDDSWSIVWQGPLPGLGSRAAQAGKTGGQLWLALQASPASEVVAVWHPAFGIDRDPVRRDVAVIQARGIAGCVNATDSAAAAEFETRVTGLLPPAPEHPGGALVLEYTAGADDCMDGLSAAADAGVVGKLTATVRAGGLVLTGSSAGYAGRPQLDQDFALGYPSGGEDALAALCPLADWEGPPAAPPACTGSCTRAVCEQLVLARKVRRFHHLAETCGTEQACIDRWADLPAGTVFPVVNGPALAFRLGIQPQVAGTTPPSTPVRDAFLGIRSGTSSSLPSGVSRLTARPSAAVPSHPNGAVAFDRSPVDAAAGYRFFVSYPADFLVDTTPSLESVEVRILR